ncbi:MAG: cytochrome c oxidase accessory protein CcoG [Rhodospirillaceae bacterium]|jgi:cytochrome c oxidase accessory protein FixG|nr:cytochrome c oxidase accessory protein CcoG [Rhodospirillaceae bacterium]MBT5110028.1 cytochrome c oxidase accessory protein CcoG [Rhodospirillaceae bacterium]MBT5811069.1 cytochrome c oxidase accessory protein CcoG [Rhodospirillaceae bacterium]
MPDKATSMDVEILDVQAVNKKENRSFTAKRIKVHPKRVYGSFRAFKWGMMAFTLGIYYLTPWLRWDRGAGAPDQAVLIDIPGRRFYFFFIEIWPQEIYYITGLLVMAAVGLFFTTSVAGRAWCGYSCPQTIWTDLFLVVERFVEGDRNARLKLDRAPTSISKIFKRLSKFTIWMIIAISTGGAWVFYFADAPALAAQLVYFEAPPAAYITIGVLASTTFLLGGFAREQVCTFMCPWPRIMSAMMDEDSLVVTYRDYRGEPRGSHKKGVAWGSTSHCVDCNQCVAACPQGIDIRDGQQLECITCALCIDACDGVMKKLDLPKGLIAYDSYSAHLQRARGESAKLRPVRPRTIFYFVAWALVGVLMLFVLLNRSDLDINVLHDRNPIFVTLSDGSIRNGYTFKILNKANSERSFIMSVSGLAGAQLSRVGSAAGLDQESTLGFTVEPDKVRAFRVFVSVAQSGLSAEATDITFTLLDSGKGTEVSYMSVFQGPAK